MYSLLMSTAALSTDPDEVAALLADFAAHVPDALDARTTPRRQGGADRLARRLDGRADPSGRPGGAPACLSVSRRADGCVIWGSTRRSTPDIAALTNGVLLRCYDYNDFFVGQRNSGHPSDMVAGVIVGGRMGRRRAARSCFPPLAVGYEVVAARLRRLLDRAGRLGLHQPHRARRDLRDRARARPRRRPGARGPGDDRGAAFRQRRDRVRAISTGAATSPCGSASTAATPCATRCRPACWRRSASRARCGRSSASRASSRSSPTRAKTRSRSSRSASPPSVRCRASPRPT